MVVDKEYLNYFGILIFEMEERDLVYLCYCVSKGFGMFLFYWSFIF